MDDRNFIILYLLVISHYITIEIKRGKNLAMYCDKKCDGCKEWSCRIFDSEGKILWK